MRGAGAVRGRFIHVYLLVNLPKVARSSDRNISTWKYKIILYLMFSSNAERDFVFVASLTKILRNIERSARLTNIWTHHITFGFIT
jgi:hypothetical protein